MRTIKCDCRLGRQCEDHRRCDTHDWVAQPSYVRPVGDLRMGALERVTVYGCVKCDAHKGESVRV